MEAEYISKKELLEQTGLSYGQLYRWKRKQLIPEEWFVKKSAFTGQETFFPKQQVMARIGKIQSLKEDHSLDEIARMFSSDPIQIHRTRAQLIEQEIVPRLLLDLYAKQRPSVSVYGFRDIFILHLLNRLLTAGEINQEEAQELIEVLEPYEGQLAEKRGVLYLIRKMGISFSFIGNESDALHFSANTRVILRRKLAPDVEELQQKLNGTGAN